MIMVIAEQEANRNYEEYLAAIGTGPCSQDMVMRADVKLTIEQVRHLRHGQKGYREIICVALLIGHREFIALSKMIKDHLEQNVDVLHLL